MLETTAFDAADYLSDEETIAEYLTAALDDPNPDAVSYTHLDVYKRQLSATSPVMILPLLWLRTGQRPTLMSLTGALLAVAGLALIFLR